MRRIFLIVLGVLGGSFALFASYAMIDFDSDDESPIIRVPSFWEQFDTAVHERTGKGYTELDENTRRNVLVELVDARTLAAVREVALYQTRELLDKGAALAIIRPLLESLPPDQYEVAVGSLSALSIPAATEFLDSLYRTLSSDPNADVPVGDYGTSTFIATNAQNDITFSFQERSRLEANYKYDSTLQSTLFFPAGPDYFVSIPNADDALAHLRSSRFANELIDSPVPEDVWSIPVLRPAATLRAKFSERLGFLGSYFTPERLIQDNVSIAGYHGQYLMVGYKDKNLGLAESILGIMQTFGASLGIQKSEFGDFTIRTMRKGRSGQTLSYTTVDDYLVAATDTTLLRRSLETFTNHPSRSFGIDPVFAKTYQSVDQSGKKEIGYVWFNPTHSLDIAGAEHQTARRRAILARALGLPLLSRSDAVTNWMGRMPGVVATTTLSGEDPLLLWRYFIGTQPQDSSPLIRLLALAGTNVGTDVMQFMGPSISVGYSGIDYMREPYGYANTGFNIVATIPLRKPPVEFSQRLSGLLASLTSMGYTQDSTAGMPNPLWLANDTSSSNLTVRGTKPRPSFMLIDNHTLLIASTPALLRSAATSFQLNATANAPASPTEYFAGTLRVDSLASNTATYLTTYLLQSDRYPPPEIEARIKPLEKAMRTLGELSWSFDIEQGLRRGSGRLAMAK